MSIVKCGNTGGVSMLSRCGDKSKSVLGPNAAQPATVAAIGLRNGLHRADEGVHLGAVHQHRRGPGLLRRRRLAGGRRTVGAATPT